MDIKDYAAIQKDTKQLLEQFSKALAKVKIVPKGAEPKEEGFREEMNGIEIEEVFKEMMFANAPLKNADHIIAEKKSW
ncbi:MAG TPA: hypothetical protein VJK51_02650 [Candidatus Nanoarchaeia archaeon]|nr:hypothetical protein [Candidatus Nanoarchaeia archaeon]